MSVDDVLLDSWPRLAAATVAQKLAEVWFYEEMTSGELLSLFCSCSLFLFLLCIMTVRRVAAVHIRDGNASRLS